MKKFLSSFKPSEIAAASIMAASLGVGLGLFINGYWLIDIFAAGSRRSLLVTGLAFGGGWIIYIPLLLWLRTQLRMFSWRQIMALGGSSILLGAIMLFATTDRWQQSVRYITFLLPNHTLDISVSSVSKDNQVQLLWFETSLGDIPLNELEYKGWKMENNRLTLTDYKNNQLRWTGKVVENVKMVFYSAAQTGSVVAKWDGQSEIFPLLDRKYNYYHFFPVPWYTSKALLILLGVLIFSMAVLPLCILIWNKRELVLPVFYSTLEPAKGNLETKDGLIILAVMLLAGLLRFPRLESLFPITDEYQQLLAAKQIIQGIPWQAVYPRSLWLLTFPISIAFRLFGYKLWVARSVGVIFNLLGVIPLYLLGRKISRPTAILATMLYATNPLIIALARVSREYAYYPVYFYSIVYLMIVLLEKIQLYVGKKGKGINLFRQPWFWLLVTLVGLPVVYALFIDVFSTFKIILIAYFVFCLFAFSFMPWDRWPIGITLILSVGLIFLMLNYKVLPNRLWLLTFDPSPIYHFFPNPPQQWYFNRLVLLPVIGLGLAITASLLNRHQNMVPMFFTALFMLTLAFFVFSPATRFEARHINTANLWYIVLLAFGLQIFWRFLASTLLFRYYLLTFLALLTINFSQILLPIRYNGSIMPITGHYHPNLKQLDSYLLVNSQNTDAIIASNAYLWYADWMDKPKFSKIYFFSVIMNQDTVLKYVSQHDSGWIVFDKIWINQLPFSPFQVFPQDDRIEYIGLFGDEYLWHWQKK